MLPPNTCYSWIRAQIYSWIIYVSSRMSLIAACTNRRYIGEHCFPSPAWSAIKHVHILNDVKRQH